MALFENCECEAIEDSADVESVGGVHIEFSTELGGGPSRQLRLQDEDGHEGESDEGHDDDFSGRPLGSVGRGDVCKKLIEEGVGCEV